MTGVGEQPGKAECMYVGLSSYVVAVAAVL